MMKPLIDAHTHTVASRWYKGGTKDENTEGMIKVIMNYWPEKFFALMKKNSLRQ
jgi:hypothetical protein